MRAERSLGRLLDRAFGGLLVLIICAGGIEAAALLLQQRVARQLTEHVQPLALANAHLRGVLADAQRGLRGYQVTGDRDLLDAYLVARSQYDLAVQDLRDLTTPGERPAVDAMVVRA